MRLVAGPVIAGLLLLACRAEDPPKPVARAGAPSASAAPVAPKEPATPSEAVTFETADKVPLSGTLYLASSANAPVLVLVHRFRGDRQEWQPLAARLSEAQRRFTILNFDLRGHGESRSASGKKRLDWADMKEKDMPAFVGDVRAALDYAFERTSGKASRAVIVGSSLGAAFAARAASQDSRVVAVGLVSPGAAIMGYDVYRPFADVRSLPSFLAGAKDDNVSKEPIDGLSRMAKDLATVKAYEGRGHGAFGLAQEGHPLWTDLETWLMGVFDAEPVAREIAPPEDGKKREKKG